MLTLGLNETINHLSMANTVQWYGLVLRREDGHVLRTFLQFDVEGQRKRGRMTWTWRKHVEEEREKVGLRMDDGR